MRILLALCLLTSPLLAEKSQFVYPLYQEEADQEVEYFKAQLWGKKSYEKLIKKNSSSLEEKLAEKIFGQKDALKRASGTIMRYAAGLHNPDKPAATMLFYGPSGVGKTELAKQITEVLYEDKESLLYLNMSEYADFNSINKLVGAPPGYVEADKGGLLSNAILENPYSVIVIDEVERADVNVWNLLLHVFESGEFTSALGKKVDCKHCIFILTTTIGSQEICDLHEEKKSYAQIEKSTHPLLVEYFTAAFCNRVEPVLFVPLSEYLMGQLVEKSLSELKERVHNYKQISLVFDQTVIEYLCKQGIDSTSGMHPLQRFIENELTTAIAKVILAGKCYRKDILKCSYHAGFIIVEKQ